MPTTAGSSGTSTRSSTNAAATTQPNADNDMFSRDGRTRLHELTQQVTTLVPSGNFHIWNKGIIDVSYFAGWPQEILDIEQQIADQWDGIE